MSLGISCTGSVVEISEKGSGLVFCVSDFICLDESIGATAPIISKMFVSVLKI